MDGGHNRGAVSPQGRHHPDLPARSSPVRACQYLGPPRLRERIGHHVSRRRESTVACPLRVAIGPLAFLLQGLDVDHRFGVANDGEWPDGRFEVLVWVPAFEAGDPGTDLALRGNRHDDRRHVVVDGALVSGGHHASVDRHLARLVAVGLEIAGRVHRGVLDPAAGVAELLAGGIDARHDPLPVEIHDPAVLNPTIRERELGLVLALRVEQGTALDHQLLTYVRL